MTAQFPYVACEIAFPFDPGGVQLAYRQEVLKDIPNGYWRLDELTGTAINDLSGYAVAAGTLNGGFTLNQTATWAGDSDPCISFNGTTGYASIPYNAALDAAAAVTVEGWVFTAAASGNQTVFEKTVGGTNATGYVLIFDTTNGLTIAVKPAGGAVVSLAYAWSNFSINTWYHVVGVCDGAFLRIYVNGAQVASTAYAGGALAVGNGVATIGGRNNGGAPTHFFNGRLDEVAVYDHALSADRVAAHYAARARTNPGADLASLPWSNVSAYFKSAATRRGRQFELGNFETGSATVEFDNTDRRFEPEYASSPYYPYVIPMRRLRLRGAYPPQLVANGGFERGAAIAPWVASGTITATTSTTPPAGAGFTATRALTGTATSGASTCSVLGDKIPVDARFPYTLTSYFLKTAAGATASALRAVCFNDAGANLGTVYPNVAAPGVTLATAPFTPAAANTWEKWGGVLAGNLPAGTTYVKPEVVLFNAPPGGANTVYADTVALTPGNNGFPDSDYFEDAPNAYSASDAWQEIWNGYVEAWPMTWPSRRRGRVQVACVDGFEPMALSTISVAMPQQLSGARIGFAADAGGWPRSERQIQAGQSQVQASSFANNLTEPVNHMALVAQTEVGTCWIGKDGQLHFEDRHARISGGIHSLSVASFGDGGPASGEMPYTTMTPNYGIERVYNRVRVTRLNGNAQQADDAASQIQYWTREYAVDGTLHISDAEALTVAGVYLSLYKQPALRFDAIAVDGRWDPKHLFPQILAREISDRVTVARRPEGTSTALVRAVHIESISHDISVDGDRAKWTTAYELSPADTNNYWVLGTSVLGTDTRLAL